MDTTTSVRSLSAEHTTGQQADGGADRGGGGGGDSNALTTPSPISSKVEPRGGNIRVCLRVRPMTEKEVKRGDEKGTKALLFEVIICS